MGQIDYTIRGAIAALIIFFPAFLYVSKIVNNDLKNNPEKKDIWVRRWMIYLTLFITGLTIAIDLATLVYRFLGAEDLTLRFFLKVFFVLAVAVTVFRSTLYDLRRTAFEYSRKIKIKMILVLVVILAAIVYGIALIGSPSTQRAKMMDDQRVSDLSSIQGQLVYSQWENKGTVPDSLSALNDPISGYTVPTDPETKAPYEYTKISKNSFELCATFKTAALSQESNAVRAVPSPNGITNENWQHYAGRDCFTRTIDPSLYKIIPTK